MQVLKILVIEGDLEVLIIWCFVGTLDLLRVFDLLGFLSTFGVLDLLMVLKISDFITTGTGVALIGFPGNPGRKRHYGRLRVFDGLVFMEVGKIQNIFPFSVVGD